MMKLRLKRFGKKFEASYRIVAVNSTSRRDGRPLAELGFYNPRTKETQLDVPAIVLRINKALNLLTQCVASSKKQKYSISLLLNF